MAGMIGCPNCGKLTDPKLENCPHCGYIQKPASAGAAEKRSAKPGTERCPICGAAISASDIICVACGTNLLTRQKIGEESQTGFARGGRPLVTWLVGVAAVVLVLIVGGLVLYWLTRDPVADAVELCRISNFIEAKDLLLKYVGKHHDDPRAHMLLGRIYWRTNQFQDAAASFETAAGLEGENADAGLMAVLSLAALAGQDTLARQAAILRDVIAASPGDARAAYLFALVLGAQGDIEGEIAVLRKLLQTEPANGGAQRSLAVALALQGEYAEAEQALNTARSNGADDGDTAMVQGFLDDFQGKPTAEPRLSAALDAGCRLRKEVLTRLGALLVSQGRFAEAQPYLKEVADSAGEIGAASFLYGVCLEAQGNANEALRRFEELGQKPGPFAAEANLHAGNIYLDQGDVERARESAGRSSGAANTAMLETLRGRIAARDGRAEEAQAAFRQAIQANPAFAPAHLENGLVFVKREVFGEAVKELEEYLRLANPDIQGTRTAQVQALADQLKQSLGSGNESGAAKSTQSAEAARAALSGGRSL